MTILEKIEYEIAVGIATEIGANISFPLVPNVLVGNAYKN